MKKFNHIQDIDEWFEPLKYEEFWYAVEPFDLMLQDRNHCDEQIAECGANMDTVLNVLKFMARRELTEQLGLKAAKKNGPKFAIIMQAGKNIQHAAARTRVSCALKRLGQTSVSEIKPFLFELTASSDPQRQACLQE